MSVERSFSGLSLDGLCSVTVPLGHPETPSAVVVSMHLRQYARSRGPHPRFRSDGEADRHLRIGASRSETRDHQSEALASALDPDRQFIPLRETRSRD